MPLKYYLFDLDDTIIDTKIYAEMYSPVLDMISSKKKMTLEKIDAKAASFGLQKNKFDRWDSGELCKHLGLLEEYYSILEMHIKVMPELNENVFKVFKRIKSKGGKIGIVSNSMERTIKAYIQKYALGEYLDLVFSWDEANCKKRQVEYWESLAKKRKIKPSECLVIGDDPEQDVEVPAKAGFHTLLVKSPKDFAKILP